eukprot:363452-Chlamydomonas_euryale.AAC.6
MLASARPRFGMHAFIRTVKDPALRVRIVNERQAFDLDPDSFRQRYAHRQRALADKIVAARRALNGVTVRAAGARVNVF